jgi:hypothetical protein
LHENYSYFIFLFFVGSMCFVKGAMRWIFLVI